MNKIIFSITFFTILLIVFFVFDSDASMIEYTYFTNDEYRYYNFSKELWLAIESNGYIATLANYYKYTGSHHFIYYFIMASFFGYIGDIAILYVLLKIMLHMIAIIFIHRWIVKVNDYDNFPLILLLIICYIPLSLLVISIMRDSLIFLLLAVGLCAVHEKKYITFSMVFLITIGFRSNAALALLIYFIVSNFFLFKEISSIKKSFILGGALILGVLVIPIVRIQTLLGSFFNVNWAFEFIRLVFSPLPWLLDSDLPIILTPWYLVSLIMVILLVLLNLIVLFSENKSNFKPLSLPLISMLFAYVTPYILIDSLGFRQLSIILPFVFIFNVTLLLKSFKEKRLVF